MNEDKHKVILDGILLNSKKKIKRQLKSNKFKDQSVLKKTNKRLVQRPTTTKKITMGRERARTKETYPSLNNHMLIE